MDWLLRKVRFPRWNAQTVDAAVDVSQLSPDPLGDLATSQKKLSFWRVQADRQNLFRVIALNAAGVDSPAECGYLVFPSNLPQELGLTVTDVPGTSPDVLANEKWHVDLTVENAGKLLEFLKMLLIHSEIRRSNANEVKNLLQEGVVKKELDPGRMKETMRQKLGFSSVSGG